MKRRPGSRIRAVVVAAMVSILGVVAAVGAPPAFVHADDVSQVIDEDASITPDFPGGATSLQLDSSEFPVIAYGAGPGAAAGGLKVMRCNDPACAGGDETVNELDSPANGRSLQLDSSGNPVLSYVNVNDRLLKVASCNDPFCSGGDETISTFPRPEFIWSSSMQLDPSGHPVVGFDGDSLGVLRCNDPVCSGDDDPIVTIDGASEGVSLQLDDAGLPVMAYADVDSGWLKVARCLDAGCSDADINAVQFLGFEAYISMALDANGFPVISHLQWGAEDEVVVLVHCNDPACADADETVNVTAAQGRNVSLQLDALGNPVISSGAQLVHCNDPECTGDDESLADFRGGANSLQLDSAGNPVFTSGAGALWLTRCDDPNCASDRDADGVVDQVDNCHDSANPDQADIDGDLVGDACDADDDGDGYDDAVDAFPSVASEWADTDADGVGNNADADDDGDGQSDVDEIACGSDPLDDGSTSRDDDGNGIPNCAEAAPPTLPTTGAGLRNLILLALTALIGGISLAALARRQRHPARSSPRSTHGTVVEP